ncbi:MAG TPA: YceI family protein [Rhodopila sp.]|jgi:polyisoprenoid-binding protein YceI
MTMRFWLSLLPLLLLAGPAWSDQAGLRPPGSAVELRSYGFGLIPLDGKFTRFHGWIRYDPANTGACQVMLDIEAGSLTMASETIRDRITGPGMMDVVRFPNLTFDGRCQGETVSGELTMHGQTHPLVLDTVRSGGTIVATGRIRRADWGITGSALIGGPTIRIKVIVPDPVSGAHI